MKNMILIVLPAFIIISMLTGSLPLLAHHFNDSFDHDLALTPVTDSFNQAVLDTNLWTIVNPAGDATLDMTGSQARIVIPSGSKHDMWTDNADALRIMQPTQDRDFEIEVKFDTLPSERYQIEGVLILQDDNNWFRFDLYHDGANLNYYAARNVAGTMMTLRSMSVDPQGSSEVFMRVERIGDRWTLSHSFNGCDWATSTIFMLPMNVTSSGVFAGNSGQPASAAPAFTALVDYFYNPDIPTISLGRGSVAIIKQTDPVGSASFDFDGDLGSFSLDGGRGQEFAQLCTGDYTIIEAEMAGWNLDRIDCTGGDVSGIDHGVTVHLEDGEEIVCTFVNQQLAATADAGGPYMGQEGTPISLDARDSTNMEIIKQYHWDCTADGHYDEITISPTAGACTYDDNGIYEVKLRTVDIFDEIGIDTAAVTVSNAAPLVNAGKNKTVSSGEEVSFSGSFLDPGSADTHTIQWAFGDGGTAEGSLTPKHTYTTAGSYKVKLTVADDDGDSGSDELTVDVINNPPIMSDISTSPAEIDEGAGITLSGLMSDNSPLTLTVDWGDDQSVTEDFATGSTSFSLDHTYADDNPSGTSADSYAIDIKLTDDEGAYSTATAAIKVNNVAPTVDAGSDKTVIMDKPVAFNAAISDPGELDTHTVTWDFGDGSPALSGVTVTHAFTGPGEFTVSVTVEDDDGGVGQDAIPVNVIEFFHIYLPAILQP